MAPRVIDMTGYDKVAHATDFHGGGAPDNQEWIVLNNNSNCYMVVSAEFLDSPHGTWHASFLYGVSNSETESELAFRRALDLMCFMALGGKRSDV